VYVRQGTWPLTDQAKQLFDPGENKKAWLTQR